MWGSTQAKALLSLFFYLHTILLCDNLHWILISAKPWNLSCVITYKPPGCKCIFTIIAPTKNKKKALDNLPCDNKEKWHSWRHIITPRSLYIMQDLISLIGIVILLCYDSSRFKRNLISLHLKKNSMKILPEEKIDKVELGESHLNFHDFCLHKAAVTHYSWNLRARDPSLRLSHYISTLMLFLPNHDLNSCVNPEPQLKV